jgi:3-methyladenine DNA glycosylase/8-oxoguanine DNA glycosylase
VSGTAAATAWLIDNDPVFAELVARHGPCRFGRRPRVDERFTTLAQAICYQQLAGRAAATIWGRVVATVGTPFTAKGVLATGEDELRAAGLSRAKMLSILDLATHVDDGRLDLRHLGRLDDEAVIAGLVHVRGIGRWTAEMFCISALHRLDIWPVTDLGVRHGYAVSHGLAELPSPAELTALADHLRPYRSVAAWYCWRASEWARAGNPD